MSDIVICECFARDGLQHEPVMLPLATKIELIDRFADMGLTRIEATSYSNPKVIPQFADASEVLAGIQRRPGVFYKATCANVRAVERALTDSDKGIGANEISLLVSATDSHSLKNLKRTRADQWKNIADMVAAASGQYRLVGTISMAFGCSFEGHVSESEVLKDVEKFSNAGVQLVALGDTTGMAVPAATQQLFAAVIREFPQVVPVAHFHDSRGTGMVNYLAAYESGVRYFDCSMGGVGGHPFKVKYGGGFTGNVCTEDWINLLESMGVNTGVDLQRMLDASAYCESVLGRALHSKVALSGLNPLLDPNSASTAS